MAISRPTHLLVRIEKKITQGAPLLIENFENYENFQNFQSAVTS